MRVVRGKVVGAAVVLEEALPDGTEVEVLARETEDEEFVLTDELRLELREASVAADRGELVEMDAALHALS